jgi:hypothetical protein
VQGIRAPILGVASAFDQAPGLERVDGGDQVVVRSMRCLVPRRCWESGPSSVSRTSASNSLTFVYVVLPYGRTALEAVRSSRGHYNAPRRNRKHDLKVC